MNTPRADAASIDLHTHTKFSDGTDTPSQLFDAALAAGLDTVAITDHDTVDGWANAAQSLPASLTLIRGAELSTQVVVAGNVISIHLLAYLFDPLLPALAAELQRLRSDRRDRGLAIVDRMRAAGLPISREQVLQIAEHASVGRPHIARALIDVGLASSVSDAFRNYLSSRSSFYVSKSDTPLEEAIALVRAAGGVPVIAHPGARGAAAIVDEAFLRRAVNWGLAGIEVDHPDHAGPTRQHLAQLANRLDLLATGSSDYHGGNKDIRIGQERSPRKVLAALVDQATSVTGVLGPGG